MITEESVLELHLNTRFFLKVALDLEMSDYSLVENHGKIYLLK